MFHKIIVYDWPYSQICMDCDYSEFIQSEKTFNSSNYVCSLNETRNDGTSCPSHSNSEEEI